jgi:uncharacterized membrane protein
VSETDLERDRDLDRFLTFVDAVVAIAITLLVLPLAELAPELGQRSVTELLREHKSELLGFFLSFAVIARLWLAQHDTVSSLVRQDRFVVRILLLWLLTIVILPFPTALVAEAGEQAATKTFYIGTMAVSSLLLTLVAWRMNRVPSIRDRDPGPDPMLAVGTVVAFLLALVITLALPATGYWPLLLLVLADPAVAAWHRARGSGSSTTRVGR